MHEYKHEIWILAEHPKYVITILWCFSLGVRAAKLDTLTQTAAFTPQVFMLQSALLCCCSRYNWNAINSLQALRWPVHTAQSVLDAAGVCMRNNLQAVVQFETDKYVTKCEKDGGVFFFPTFHHCCFPSFFVFFFIYSVVISLPPASSSTDDLHGHVDKSIYLNIINIDQGTAYEDTLWYEMHFCTAGHYTCNWNSLCGALLLCLIKRGWNKSVFHSTTTPFRTFLRESIMKWWLFFWFFFY